MRDTIKARESYRIVKATNVITGEQGYRIDDGLNPLFFAQMRTYKDYLDERNQNEMFRFCEVFTTVDGDQYIYWRDDEIDEDYITKVED